MKKIPTLFKRDYEGNRQVFNEVVEGCEWVLAGEGVATEKIDGTCCLIQGGVLYKRYDARRGKPVPEGFIPAQDEADPETGHWPGWMKVTDSPEDKWHREAFENAENELEDGTYELIGPKVQGNPYHKTGHDLWKHGDSVLASDCPRDFEGLKAWLAVRRMEGIVWHHSDGRMCKLKRRDFGFIWPI